MPVRRLPPTPNLDHLKHQAKDLLKGHAAHDPASAQRMREFHPRFSAAADAKIFAAQMKLSDAQLTIAREAGFQTWSRLKMYVQSKTPGDRLNLPLQEQIEDLGFRRAVDLLDAGDSPGLRSLLREHPELARQRVVFEGRNYFRNPSLLEFVAGNPIRHPTMPKNTPELAEIILSASAEKRSINDTLGLVSSGKLPREAGVQVRLIELLCAHGADPHAPVRAAALHGETEAVQALLDRGARLDLPVAASLGRIDDFLLLLPAAGENDRHLALAAAAQFGHVEIVRTLLDAGEDPDRYNSPGAHSHSTPLHQAALAGHEAVVRLLIARGAKLDIKDILWHGTPADWASHGGNAQIEKLLRLADTGRNSKG